MAIRRTFKGKVIALTINIWWRMMSSSNGRYAWNVHWTNRWETIVYLRERDSPLSPRTGFYKNVNHHTRKFRNGDRLVRGGGGGIEIQVSYTKTIENRARHTIILPHWSRRRARRATIFYWKKIRNRKRNAMRSGARHAMISVRVYFRTARMDRPKWRTENERKKITYASYAHIRW